MSDIQKIGIVGGGQLAQMMTEPALKLGFEVTVIDPTPNCPAAQVGATQIHADYKDAVAIRNLAEDTDVLTIDFEHVNTEVLAKLESEGFNIQPKPETVAMIQDKLQQCNFLKQNDLPLADYRQLDTLDQAREVLLEFGGKMMLKKRHHSYDGKGNALINNIHELEAAWQEFAGSDLYAEKLVDFINELAVVLARDTSGNITIYPVVETVHINNICHEVFLPAPISEDLKNMAKDLALTTAKHLKGAGVFAIEMFLTKNTKILINEIAPRVHNSGHPTIEGSATSQFEQHIRAITGMKLGSTEMKASAAVMINILGNRNGTSNPENIDEAEKIPGISVHMYGKDEVKDDRKMGHITAVADTIEIAKDNAEKAHSIVKV